MDEHARFHAALRALDLAIMIRDEARIDLAKNNLLHLHHDAIEAKDGLWVIAFDRLIGEKRAGVTDADRGKLVAGFEGLATRYSNTTDPTAFDPHKTETVARRLTKYSERSHLCGRYG